jgi:toxin ParE1/3/4
MALSIRRRPKARQDLLEIADWLDQQSSWLVAAQFLQAAEDTIECLAAQPTIAALWDTDLGHAEEIYVWPVRGFPNYLIFYRVQADVLEIVRVLHAARDLETAFDSPT